MIKEIIILTKSRKNSGYCIAGIDIITGKWVRIVSDGIECYSNELKDYHIVYRSGKTVKIFDIVEVECEPCSNYFQPENYIIKSNENYVFTFLGRASLELVLKLHPLEKKDFLFYNESYKIEDNFLRNLPNDAKYSLILIKPDNPLFEIETRGNGKKKINAQFNYNGVNYRFFSVTDIDMESKISTIKDNLYIPNNELLFVISLGELYERDNCHYKLIAGVLGNNEDPF